MRKAIIVDTDSEIREVRCISCGKLLFKFMEKERNQVDKSKHSVIIVARCTRNTCKEDNEVII